MISQWFMLLKSVCKNGNIFPRKLNQEESLCSTFNLWSLKYSSLKLGKNIFSQIIQEERTYIDENIYLRFAIWHRNLTYFYPSTETFHCQYAVRLGHIKDFNCNWSVSKAQYLTNHTADLAVSHFSSFSFRSFYFSIFVSDSCYFCLLSFFVCFYISDSTEFPIGNAQFHPMVDCQSLFPI